MTLNFFIALTSYHFVTKPFSNRHTKCSLDRWANEVLVRAKLQLQAYYCRDCWIQWGGVLHCHSASPLSYWYFLKIISKETVQRSYGSLSPFFAKVIFFHVAPAVKVATAMDIMPSKILHNLRSVAIVNLLSRFCNQSFNQFLCILIILRDICYCSNKEDFLHSWIFKFLWQT